MPRAFTVPVHQVDELVQVGSGEWINTDWFHRLFSGNLWKPWVLSPNLGGSWKCSQAILGMYESHWSHRLEPTKTFIFSKNHHFGYHQNHLKVFGCLDSCFCVFMWIIIEIFTKRPRSPGSSDMEKSLQSCCGPFWELEKLSNCVKSGKKPEIVAKKTRFPFFFRCIFNLFSFVRFFRSFFSFLLLILVGFSRFWIQFDKIPKLQTTSIFSVCFCVFFVLFIFVFFRTIFETEKTFSIYSRIPNNFQFIFELRKNFWIIFEPETHFDFVFAITGAIASDLRDPGKICCNKLKRHVLGTFRDDGKLTSYGFDKLGDDFVMFWVMMKMIINWKRTYFWISNVWLAEIAIKLLYVLIIIIHFADGFSEMLRTVIFMPGDVATSCQQIRTKQFRG